MTALAALPSTTVETREGLRALACYVIAPARKAATGRIGLRATGDGFGTPTFGDDGRRVIVRADRLIVESGGSTVAEALITTLRDAAALVGVELVADPGVGHDRPPFEPDAPLAVDGHASEVLGAWFAFGASALGTVHDELGGSASDVQLWPEHFDLGFDWGRDDVHRVNLGASPGDAAHPEPYLYVGPWVREHLDHPYWNAPFGALLPYADLFSADYPATVAAEFFTHGLELLP